MNGIINIYKPTGMTSHDVVFRLRRFLGIKRIGHGGTLDPMATGVLPVLIGNACSGQDIIMEHEKTYIAGIRFGTLTDTGDITGNIIKVCEDVPDAEKIKSAGESFVGSLMQYPPMYSAVKIDGKKLYELAREGKTVEREAREIYIYKSTFVSKVSDTDYLFSFSVSKGTYIRVLAEDIGKVLGCGATLISLERTVCGSFTSENSIGLDDFCSLVEKEGESAAEKYLLPTEKAFDFMPAVILSEFYSGLCKNGVEIYLSRAKISEKIFDTQGRCRLYDSDGNFFAIGVLRDFPDGKAIKAKIRFDTK